MSIEITKIKKMPRVIIRCLFLNGLRGKEIYKDILDIPSPEDENRSERPVYNGSKLNKRFNFTILLYILLKLNTTFMIDK